MNRFLSRVVVLSVAGLAHWNCCNCDDKVTSPPVVVATPTPAPTPTPTTCTISGLPADFRCSQEPPPVFESIVVAAQDAVRRDHPEIFDGAGKVFSQETYTGWVAQTLRAQGHCAIGGTDDELSIKKDNSSSELYDLVTSNRDTWTNYVFTCRPSLF
jgi:hypothetical protein